MTPATAENVAESVAESTAESTAPQDALQDSASDVRSADVPAADALVEDVSIDGMCGVY